MVFSFVMCILAELITYFKLFNKKEIGNVDRNFR